VLTSEELNEIFEYDNETGELYWKVQLSNRVKIGDRVGSLSCGYLRTSVFGIKLFVHIIIWMMHNGTIPNNLEIDHRDCDKLNNRLKNLRLATRAENNRNIPAYGSSGLKGVTWDSSRNKWHAQLQHGKTNIHLGYFKDKMEAAEAYEAKAIELQGQFARGM
jgi:hypothetical protein